ncbi:putative Dynactin subunit 3 protein [Naja naja]|nr:putative Dynactin subunit 3 protein [Naja naja]
MAVYEVQQLQNRLDALEERMFGAPAGVASAGAPRKRVKILFKKIEDILKYLDPQYIDRMAVPDAMKLQFILAASSDHATKLQRLSQIHLQQQTLLLSKQFVQWDEMLTQLEAAKQVKPIAE